MTKRRYIAKHRSKLDAWQEFSDHHWMRLLENGTRLDYWPTRDKFKVGGRAAQMGDVDAFIADRRPSADSIAPEGRSWPAEKVKAAKSAWYSYQHIGDNLDIHVCHQGRTGPEAAAQVIEALHKVLEFYDREERKAA